MSAPKTAVVYGLLGNVESTYGTLPSLTGASHSIQLAELPDIGDDWGFDGARPNPPGSAGTQIRVGPAGRIIRPLSLKVEGKGGGAAYSAGVKPRDLSVLLRIAGFSETLDATGGAEKYTFVPTAPTAAPSSGGLEAYCRSNLSGNVEKWPINGAYADWSFDVEDGKPGIWTFDVQGRLDAAPSEVSWPTFTYAPTVLPPTAAPLSLSINAVTSLVCRKIGVKGNRGVQARFPDENTAAGHAGFHPGRRAIELTALIEKPLFATLNPHLLRAAGTPFASSFTVGATAYNKQGFTFAQSQVKSVTDSQDGEVPLVELVISCHVSTPVLADDMSLVFN